jgi:predicted phosphodiesterase
LKIAVISDLHLGSGGPTDLFGHDDAEFLGFLGFLEQNFERIVLLGDIWETLTAVLPGSPLLALTEARKRHREIARRFQRPSYAFVHGNHDIVAATQGAPDEITIEADGMRLLFTHGHQNDPIVQRARWLSEMGVWLGGWIRRVGLSAMYQSIRELDQSRGGASLDATRCTFQRWAVEVARVRSADVVVTGHTHLATRAEHGDRLFLNSGSCSGGEISFLGIDTKSGTFGVHRTW